MTSQDLEQFAFRWLQTQLAEILASEPHAFPAKLPLSQLPGQPSLRKLYAMLRRRGVCLPPLYLTWTQIILLGFPPCCLVIAIAWGIVARRGEISLSESAGAMVTGLITWAALSKLAKLFIAQKSSADTVGELAQQLFWQNATFFSRHAGIPLSHEQIRRIVIRVLADSTGVGVDEITDETRLVELTE